MVLRSSSLFFFFACGILTRLRGITSTYAMDFFPPHVCGASEIEARKVEPLWISAIWEMGNVQVHKDPFLDGLVGSGAPSSTFVSHSSMMCVFSPHVELFGLSPFFLYKGDRCN